MPTTEYTYERESFSRRWGPVPSAIDPEAAAHALAGCEVTKERTPVSMPEMYCARPHAMHAVAHVAGAKEEDLL